MLQLTGILFLHSRAIKSKSKESKKDLEKLQQLGAARHTCTRGAVCDSYRLCRGSWDWAARDVANAKHCNGSAKTLTVLVLFLRASTDARPFPAISAFLAGIVTGELPMCRFFVCCTVLQAPAAPAARKRACSQVQGLQFILQTADGGDDDLHAAAHDAKWNEHDGRERRRRGGGRGGGGGGGRMRSRRRRRTTTTGTSPRSPLPA